MTARLSSIQAAILDLKSARSHLRKAGAIKAADYAARAIKSAEGAERHAYRMRADEIRDAETLARAKGWREGGGYIYDSAVFDSWKEAVSWCGDDGRNEDERGSRLYDSWGACVAGETMLMEGRADV